VKGDPVVKQGLSKLFLLDIIAGQVDHHPGNYMAEVKDDKVVGIKAFDNDLAFGGKMTPEKQTELGEAAMKKQFGQFTEQYVRSLTNNPILNEIKDIDKPFAEKIIALNNNPGLVRNALQGLLTSDEVDMTIRRLQHLANFLAQVFSGKGPNDVRLIEDWTKA
jgi:hypothetical protein